MLHPISSLKKYHLAASDGHLGHIRDVYFDSHEWTVRCLVVKTGAWLLGSYFMVKTSVWFGKEVAVPTTAIREVSWDRSAVYLSIPRERVKSAPEYDADAPRIEAYERRVASYYDGDGRVRK